MSKKAIIKVVAGARFNRLTIIREIKPEIQIKKDGSIQKIRTVECKCECGNEIKLRLSSVRFSHTKSCGCLRLETAKINTDQYTHGFSHKQIHNKWCAMKGRCYNKKNKSYEWYGGKGVVVCEVWLNDFMFFYNWAINNGYREELTIDRINVNGNYEPNNCRWATWEEQANNKTNSIVVKINDNPMSLSDACRKFGYNYKRVHRLMTKYNFTFETAITFKYRQQVKL